MGRTLFKKTKTKKILIIGIVIGILILGVGGFLLLNFDSKNVGKMVKQTKDTETKIICEDFDDNKKQCLLHNECKWTSDKNLCDSIDEGGDFDEEDDKLKPELESIVIPNNPSNTLCKKIPLSNKPPYGERYRCLAIVNHDERFCEGMDEEKEKLMCLAFTKKDSSYCELVPQGSRHVCYIQLSVSSENANFCSDISYSQHEKEQCYMNYITNLYAWDESDEIKTEYCNQLDTPDKYTCLALKSRDVSLCGNNPHCLTFFEQDISFCNEHPELPCCIKDRAKTSKDVSICELLPQPDRDNCVGSYCTHTELNVNICDTIIDIKERQARYLELAMNLGNR